jgi:transposase
MDVMFTHGAGLDVHKKTVMACRVTPDPTGQQADGVMELQAFGTMTRDLLALSDWLAEVGVTHVAMESTGEYWRPIYNLLEGSFTMLLVNAAHVKRVPGRKTDKADARGLAKLMRYGLLAASFIPPQGQRDLRELTRYRTKLIQERSREVNRVQGVLERANIKLAAVATDIMGVSGRAILAALIHGRTDPATMAELATGRMRTKLPLLEQALTGLTRDHHRRLLTMQLAHIDFLDEQIDALSVAIMRYLTALERGLPVECARRRQVHWFPSVRARCACWSRAARRSMRAFSIGRATIASPVCPKMITSHRDTTSADALRNAVTAVMVCHWLIIGLPLPLP